MLISMPTGTSTIFGVFQAIVGLLAHYERDLSSSSTGRLTWSSECAIEFQIGGQNFVTSPLFECGASFRLQLLHCESSIKKLYRTPTFNLPTTITPQTAWFSQHPGYRIRFQRCRDQHEQGGLLNLPRAQSKCPMQISSAGSNGLAISSPSIRSLSQPKASKISRCAGNAMDRRRHD